MAATQTRHFSNRSTPTSLADTVADQVANDAEAVGFDVFLDGRRDVADPVVDAGLLDTELQAQLDALWAAAERVDSLQAYNPRYDAVVSLGELASSRILAAALKADGQDAAWLDAREVLATDAVYRRATVDWDQTAARTSRRRTEASHNKAAPVSATGTSEPRFSHCQPCVVTSAPDAKDVKAMVANTQKLMAACARSFSSGR